MIPGAEVSALLPALADRAPTSGYLFYDCQTDDSRLVLTVLAEAERFGAVAANRLEATELIEERGRAVGACVKDTETGDELEIRATTVVNATGVWADRLRPAELHDEAEVPIIRPSRGTHLVVDRDTAADGGGRDRPRRRGAHDLRAAVARADADRHHRHRPRRRRPTTSSRPRSDVGYLLDAVNAFFETALTPAGPRGRVRGRPTADLDRRPRQIGRHQPQGRALRDLQRHDHDHRRQAHDLAADGQADRRPDRRARRLRHPLRHAGDPARDGGRAGGPRRRAGVRPRAARRPLRAHRPRRARPPATCSSRSSRAAPTCWPRSPTRPGASRRARSATCCCAARGSG